MVNFLGPGAFDCARPATSRPEHTPENGPGDVDDWFKDCTSPLARDGTEWRATILNFLIANLRGVVRKSGVAASNIDDDIFVRALRSQGYTFYAAPGGTANDLTVVSDPTFASAAALIGVPLLLKTGAGANTGAVTLVVDSLAPIGVTWPDGTALAAGDLPAATLALLRYDGTAFRMSLCLSPTQVKALQPQPNLVVNGDFQINQRAFAGGALANGVYGFDRWKASGASSMTLAGHVLTLASGEIHQVVEPAFWGYSSLASTTLTVSVENPSQTVLVTLGSVSGTISSGAGRRSVTLTTAVGDTGNLSLKLARSGGGSVSFGRVKLEVGAVPTAWQARNAWQEMLLAYRYFWKFIAPYLDARLGDAGSLQDSGLFTINLYMPAEMRVTPTVTWASLSRKVSSNVSLSTLSSVALHKHSLALAFTSAPISPGVVYPASLVSATAGAHLTLDAEL